MVHVGAVARGVAVHGARVGLRVLRVRRREDQTREAEDANVGSAKIQLPGIYDQHFLYVYVHGVAFFMYAT